MIMLDGRAPYYEDEGDVNLDALVMCILCRGKKNKKTKTITKKQKTKNKKKILLKSKQVANNILDLRWRYPIQTYSTRPPTKGCCMLSKKFSTAMAWIR